MRYSGRELFTWLGLGGDELIDLRDSIVARDDRGELMAPVCVPVQSSQSHHNDENRTEVAITR